MLTVGSIVNKDAALELSLSSLNSKPHICLFTETWLSGNLLAPNFVYHLGHHMFHDGRNGGSVSIYGQNDPKCHDIKCCNKSTFDYIVTVVKINELMSVLAICIYRLPNMM